jgi:hypothetical protein
MLASCSFKTQRLANHSAGLKPELASRGHGTDLNIQTTTIKPNVTSKD